MSLKNDCAIIWKKNFDRRDINNVFKPIFKRYIGVEEPPAYNNFLKTLQVNIDKNKDRTVFFENGIPFNVDFNLIQYINSELPRMDLNHLSTQDITVFDNLDINKMFLEALEYVVNIAFKKEKFFNENVKYNFIAKLIIWSLSYIKDISFDDEMVPKCIYYGKITRHEIYFLLMLYRMTFDVLYINPLKDETDFWNDIDLDSLSKKELSSTIEQLKTFAERVQSASEVHSIQSTTKIYENQIEQEFFTNTGIYKPWQFKEYDTVSMFLNSSLIDIETKLNEPAKVREGFEIKDKKVYIPTFFHVIDGVYEDKDKYSELVKKCSLIPNTLLIKDTGRQFLPVNLDINDAYKIMFYQLSDGSFDMEGIKKLPFYPLSCYSLTTQNLLLSKINELIRDKTLFSLNVSKEEVLQTVLFLLNINKAFVRLINNFDFPGDVPKIVVFLENEQILSNEMIILLAFLNKIGLDIIIFNPAGLFSIDGVINRERFNVSRLDTTQYDCTYDNIIRNNNKVKKGFFSRLFG